MTTSLAELAQRIPDGAHLAIPPEYSFVPMALVRALIRRQARDLRVLVVPIGGVAVDMLIGAGCVRSLEAAAVSLGEQGLAPRFTAAIEAGELEMRDSTCPAIHAALQASEKGVPFMPLGGLIGSDILANRPDWRVVDDPFGAGNGPIVLLPALRPEFAVFHSPMADRDGNVWIGRRRELATMAHAARQTFVTVERITDDSLLATEASAAATLPATYISAVTVAAKGAWPLALVDHYAADAGAIAEYAAMAGSQAGFDAYVRSHVFEDAAA